ncbi:hypothetical protein MWU65_10760 [Cellulophaga sp. F20128]|uniref:hypothetical protein n=1 Tax=Cellulophaga sp. F20128 TaxID=2926413 RepID=UPI001FF3E22D|nr:hypothetical protein [Cellulophaga sp. F20128]MCK0157663.1 hypothetical protein [Cellulophaga sp. F20128]
MENLTKMKFVLLILCFTSLGCSNDDSNNEVVWNGVFFDRQLNADIHDPKVNYVLVIDSSNNFEVISPSEGLEEKIVAIEIINTNEMNLTWQIGNETSVIKVNFSFQNENELIIDKFIYTLAQTPFPNNLISGKFIKETKTNN